jgi:hypothetical protein
MFLSYYDVLLLDYSSILLYSYSFREIISCKKCRSLLEMQSVNEKKRLFTDLFNEKVMAIRFLF